MTKSWETAPLPEPVYGCASSDCAAEVSYPANMLYWWAGSKEASAGFYCRESGGCLDEIQGTYYGDRIDAMDEDPDGMVGPSLAEAKGVILR